MFDTLVHHAESGLNAGRVITQRLQPYLSQVMTPRPSAHGTYNIVVSDYLKAKPQNTVQSFDLAGRLPPNGELFDVTDLPVLTDLFGDNPQRWRAFAALSVTDVLESTAMRADIYLNGGELVDEIIERAIAWRRLINDSDAGRFKGLTTDEQYELAVRVSAGWRKY